MGRNGVSLLVHSSSPHSSVLSHVPGSTGVTCRNTHLLLESDDHALLAEHGDDMFS